MKKDIGEAATWPDRAEEWMMARTALYIGEVRNVGTILIWNLVEIRKKASRSVPDFLLSSIKTLSMSVLNSTVLHWAQASRQTRARRRISPTSSIAPRATLPATSEGHVTTIRTGERRMSRIVTPTRK